MSFDRSWHFQVVVVPDWSLLLHGVKQVASCLYLNGRFRSMVLTDIVLVFCGWFLSAVSHYLLGLSFLVKPKTIFTGIVAYIH